MLQAHRCAALPADTAGARGEKAGDHVHLLKVLAVLLELCFGRSWFLFEFPCQPSPAQCFREESALQKGLKKKRLDASLRNYSTPSCANWSHTHNTDGLQIFFLVDHLAVVRGGFLLGLIFVLICRGVDFLKAFAKWGCGPPQPGWGFCFIAALHLPLEAPVDVPFCGQAEHHLASNLVFPSPSQKAHVPWPG